MQHRTSGIPSLDDLLGGGLVLGDNVVWLGEARSDVDGAAAAFLGPDDADRHLVSLGPRAIDVAGGVAVHRIDLATTSLADLEALLVGHHIVDGTRLVIDGLDELLTHLGADATVAFYRRMCPRLLDLGAIAYWTGTRGQLSPAVIGGVSKIAQCVLERRDDRLRITKAEGRPNRVQGMLVDFAADPDTGSLRVGREHAVGRLGEGLRRIRNDRNLTQGQLAALAGITPAAISQAETGRRGLSLDTVVPLCEVLRVTVDELLGGQGRIDHQLVRHDRRRDDATGRGTGVVPLFDDPTMSVRAFLTVLDPDESGAPTFAHKGIELILVADGLVLIDLGDQTPVLRAGDALMVNRVPIHRWENLRRDPARLFWVVAD
ncbi:MAG: XRE family transcriptional regulator [Acidimicrobiales bacterium]|nr:XRE family transcriptional regulator [Acidimicrobiales bacterium]